MDSVLGFLVAAGSDRPTLVPAEQACEGGWSRHRRSLLVVEYMLTTGIPPHMDGRPVAAMVAPTITRRSSLPRRTAARGSAA